MLWSAAPASRELGVSSLPQIGSTRTAPLLDKLRTGWDKKDIATLVVVSGSGLVIWVGIALGYGVREAWDSPAFFMLGLPLMLLVTGIAGLLRPGKFSLWGMAIVLPQPLAMSIMAPLSDAPLIGGGIFFFLVFVVICTISSFAGFVVRKLSDWAFRKLSNK